ncbi:hypothetical protein Hanom_Chr02g00124361 [Helianthus anomalus]
MRPDRVNVNVVLKVESNVLFESSHNTCSVYDETLPKLVVFKEILPFMNVYQFKKL